MAMVCMELMKPANARDRAVLAGYLTLFPLKSAESQLDVGACQLQCYRSVVTKLIYRLQRVPNAALGEAERNRVKDVVDKLLRATEVCGRSLAKHRARPSRRLAPRGGSRRCRAFATFCPRNIVWSHF